MRNVHYTCDRCGEILKRPGENVRGELDCPDVTVAVTSENTRLCFHMCEPCLKETIAGMRIQSARGDQRLHPDGRSVGDVLRDVKPYTRSF
jgi:hypothetical protein